MDVGAISIGDSLRNQGAYSSPPNLKRKFKISGKIPMALVTPDWKSAWFDQRLAERLTRDMAQACQTIAPALDNAEQWLVQCSIETGRLAQAVQTLCIKEGQGEELTSVTAARALRLSAIALLMTASLEEKARERQQIHQTIAHSPGQHLAQPTPNRSQHGVVEASAPVKSATNPAAQWLDIQNKQDSQSALLKNKVKTPHNKHPSALKQTTPFIEEGEAGLLGELMVGSDGKAVASQNSLRETAKSMYANGFSVREIAGVLGCKALWVREVLNPVERGPAPPKSTA